MNKIKWNVPIVSKWFTNNHDLMTDPILFPCFVFSPIHAKVPIAWIEGLVGSSDNETSNNHLFYNVHTFDLFFIKTSGVEMSHPITILKYTQQFFMGMVSRDNVSMKGCG